MTTLTVRATVYTDPLYGPYTAFGSIVTWQNYGPLTTTYTPEPSCTATDRLFIGPRVEEDGDHPSLWYSLDCEPTSNEYSDCIPTPTTTPMSIAEGQRLPIGTYYSPGIQCPSGWETIGQAARDGEKPPTTSGAMSFGATPTSFPYYGYEPAILARSLQPSETIVLCCPSGFTADKYGPCWNSVTTYTPTQGCTVSRTKSVEYTTTPLLYTDFGAEQTWIDYIPVSIHYLPRTYSTSWGLDDVYATYLTAYSSVDPVTLIHHETDISPVATDASAATKSPDISDVKEAESTSNNAARLLPRTSEWEGLGITLGFSVAAFVLGVAVVLPL